MGRNVALFSSLSAHATGRRLVPTIGSVANQLGFPKDFI